MLAQMIRSVSFAVVVAGMAFVFPGKASSADPTSFVVLDFQQIEGESLAGKAARAQFLAYQRQIKIDSDEASKKANERARELQKQKTILGTEAFKKKLAELNRGISVFKQDLQGFDRTLNASYQKTLAVITDRVITITKKIAQARGVDAVLRRGSVLLLMDDKLNITAEVIAELDKVLPTVKLEVPKRAKPKKAGAK